MEAPTCVPLCQEETASHTEAHLHVPSSEGREGALNRAAWASRAARMLLGVHAHPLRSALTGNGTVYGGERPRPERPGYWPSPAGPGAVPTPRAGRHRRSVGRADALPRGPDSPGKTRAGVRGEVPTWTGARAQDPRPQTGRPEPRAPLGAGEPTRRGAREVREPRAAGSPGSRDQVRRQPARPLYLPPVDLPLRPPPPQRLP